MARPLERTSLDPLVLLPRAYFGGIYSLVVAVVVLVAVASGVKPIF